MARIRTLKPEFFQSRSLAQCPIDARLTFAGLWTQADDHGRGRADARLLKGQLWPLDDDCTFLHVSAHLDVLAATGHIRLYEVAGEPYYEIVHWEEHQAPAYRRGVARYPSPGKDSSPLHDSARQDVQESAPRTTKSAGSGNEERGREQGTGDQTRSREEVSADLATLPAKLIASIVHDHRAARTLRKSRRWPEYQHVLADFSDDLDVDGLGEAIDVFCELAGDGYADTPNLLRAACSKVAIRNYSRTDLIEDPEWAKEWKL